MVIRKVLRLLLGRNDAEFDEAGILIKIMTNYIQIIAVLATFRLELPDGFLTVSDTAG